MGKRNAPPYGSTLGIAKAFIPIVLLALAPELTEVALRPVDRRDELSGAARAGVSLRTRIADGATRPTPRWHAVVTAA